MVLYSDSKTVANLSRAVEPLTADALGIDDFHWFDVSVAVAIVAERDVQMKDGTSDRFVDERLRSVVG